MMRKSRRADTQSVSVVFGKVTLYCLCDEIEDAQAVAQLQQIARSKDQRNYKAPTIFVKLGWIWFETHGENRN